MAVNKIELSLKKVLQKAIIDLKFVEDYPLEQIVIEIPKDKAHGDYSTNMAMQLTKVEDFTLNVGKISISSEIKIAPPLPLRGSDESSFEQFMKLQFDIKTSNMC